MHTYRRKKYAFFIVIVLMKLRQGDLRNIENDVIMNTMFNLLIYGRQIGQYVYKLSTLHHYTIYMINVFNESN